MTELPAAILRQWLSPRCGFFHCSRTNLRLVFASSKPRRFVLRIVSILELTGDFPRSTPQPPSILRPRWGRASVAAPSARGR
jgi:hypothetical protein